MAREIEGSTSQIVPDETIEAIAQKNREAIEFARAFTGFKGRDRLRPAQKVAVLGKEGFLSEAVCHYAISELGKITREQWKRARPDRKVSWDVLCMEYGVTKEKIGEWEATLLKEGLIHHVFRAGLREGASIEGISFAPLAASIQVMDGILAKHGHSDLT